MEQQYSDSMERSVPLKCSSMPIIHSLDFYLKPLSQTQHIMSPPQICPSFLNLAHSKDCSIQIIGHNKIKP